MKMTKAKTIAAAIGTVAQLVTLLLADDVLGMDDAAKLVATVIEQAVTVYAVWRVPNKPAEG